MIERLLESDKLRELQHAFQEGRNVLIEHLWNAPKALIAALALKATGKHILILTGASQEEVRLFHDFAFFSDRSVVNFPAWETLPNEKIAPSPDVVGERYKVLREVANAGEPYIILTSLQACLQRLIPINTFTSLNLTLKVGDAISFASLIPKLESMGYRKASVAADKGEFAVRGGILDIFPVSSPDPYRLEFFGDEIESMRIYDPIGQKSVRAAQLLELTPGQELEMLVKNQQLCTILDYLGKDTLVIFDDILALEDRYASLMKVCDEPTPTFSSIEALMEQMALLQQMYWSAQPIEELSEISLAKGAGSFYSANAPMQELTFHMFNRPLKAKRWKHPFAPISDYLLPEIDPGEGVSSQELLHALGRLHDSPLKIEILCSTETEETVFQKKLQDQAIILPKQTRYSLGYLSSGFVMKDIEWMLLPLTELTHRYKIRRQKQRSTYHTTPIETYELLPGDYVVHFHNGIGKYLGMEQRPNHNGQMTDFMLVEYAEGTKLFVPLNQSYLVSKYIGSDEGAPKLHQLGSARWKKTKDQTQQAIMGYATELLEMHARREIKGGTSCDPDSPDMEAFEEEFPFVETEDQLSAIAAIKTDMMETKPMDRLICGDVGYGKTEVAMRAAFKAVVDGHKQVAVLVPTTVLAMQHYENFAERMANFPVEVAVLSRFLPPKQVRKNIENAAKGTVDILIGTHRIISEDVVFKDLGLVIIDEEQRFGVKAKEHLKKIKAGVDTLTLSATPIPRTLYMSLIGARDMSVINTPPQDRLPITTIVTERNDQTIKNALLRELSRDGQAYIIHNRVETIFEFAAHIQKLLPQARIAVGHGQMHADEIDTVFHAFKSGKADILIATTIVENGIDIPNANTILIDRADTFGMADLYQLRGRVGRWNRRAYAYFLVPSVSILPELVRKRLGALAESSGYGGGMKVAMRDLELRGAGNILGTEQSGHVSAIGFHLYCKLLKRTISTLQGQTPASLTDTKMEFPVDARIPGEYIHEVSLRMEIYQRLGEAVSWDEIDDLWNEMQDRYGTPPEPAVWLYHFSRLRVFASIKGLSLLKLDKLSLLAEKQHPKYTESKKILMTFPKTPQEMEAKVLAALKKEFGE